MRQLVFLNALSISRNVTKAARTVGMSRESAYRLRARLDGALFGARWDQILRHRLIVPQPPTPGHESHDGGTNFVNGRFRAPP